MKRNEKLYSKIKEMIALYKKFNAPPSADKDPVEKKLLAIEASAALDRLKHLYFEIMGKIPAEKRDEVHADIEEKYKTIIPESTYKLVKTNIMMDSDLPTQDMKDHYLFYKCHNAIINSDKFNEMIEIASEYIDDQVIDEIYNGIDSYQSPSNTNVIIYSMRPRVEEQKKKNQETVTDPDKLNALNEELDKVAEMVKTSHKDYTESYGDGYDAAHESIRNRRNDALNDEYLKKDEYKELCQYFNVRKDGLYCGVREVKPELYGDVEMAKNIKDITPQIVIPENVKNALRHIISFMDESGMLKYGGTSGEAGSKAYGFTQIAHAHNALVAAISSDDPEKIKEARSNYETAVENMRRVFSMIEEELHPTTDNLIGNVSSYRETWVPAEFKNNLAHNAIASGIYNLAVSLQGNGISLEELLNDPKETIYNTMIGYASQSTPNDRLSVQSFSESVLDVIKGTEKRSTYPAGGVARNTEFLTQLTFGTPEYGQNILSAMALASYDAYILNLSQRSNPASTFGYLSEKGYETLANIFLVNEEDRDYNKLRAFEATTVDGFRKIPPFDSANYIQNHKLDPSVIVDRIMTTARELHDRVNPNNSKGITDSEMKSLIQGAQTAAYEFLMINTTPDTPKDKEAYKTLQQMIDKPERVFADYMSKSLTADIKKNRSVSGKIKDAAVRGKEALNNARIEARKAESVYNEKANELQDRIASLTENINKDGNSENLTAELNAAKASFDALKKEEAARLESEYLNGKLTKDYLENRRENILRAEHEKSVPFGVSECPSFKKFKAQYANELKAGELTSEDVKFFYDRLIETAKVEENKFILTATGTHPKPTLEEAEPVAEADDIQINEDRVSISLEDDIKDDKIEKSGQVEINSASKSKNKEI